jgi:hypothetical protein
MPAADARRVRAAPRRCEQAEHNLLAAPAPCRVAASHTAPRLATRLAAPHDVRVTH